MILMFGKGLTYWTGLLSLISILITIIGSRYFGKSERARKFLFVTRKVILPLVLIHATFAILAINFGVVI